MNIREWQRKCVTAAINSYAEKNQIFSVLAAPGAGKTIMSAIVAKKLIELELIDFIVFLSPTANVASNVKSVFSGVLRNGFDGMFGSLGVSKTYQSLTTLNDEFWWIFSNFRVLVILDEVHHLGGHQTDLANVWGMEVMKNIQSKAQFILSMSGTPWRSDYKPITTLQWHQYSQSTYCDFLYGLGKAVQDNVCRVPVINFVDNCALKFQGNDGKVVSYDGILSLLEHEKCRYEQIVTNDAILTFILKTSISKLNFIRAHNRNAAGLIVASSIRHAEQIYEMLINHFNESAELVACSLSDSLDTISAFEQSETRWLVSVSMVSEGTDIPRLQLCCHLSRIKTEMYFRQVLGRIIRRQQSDNITEAYLYLPMQADHLAYAKRLLEDIPEGYINTDTAELDAIVKDDSCEVTSVLENINDEMANAPAKPNQADIVNEATASDDLLDYFLSTLRVAGNYSVTHCLIDGLS